MMKKQQVKGPAGPASGNKPEKRPAKGNHAGTHGGHTGLKSKKGC